MTTYTFIYETKRPFNYGAFAKYLVTSGNILWSISPGHYCKTARFIKAVEVELCVNTDVARKIVYTMIDLGLIFKNDYDKTVTIAKELRQ